MKADTRFTCWRQKTECSTEISSYGLQGRGRREVAFLPSPSLLDTDSLVKYGQNSQNRNPVDKVLGNQSSKSKEQIRKNKYKTRAPENELAVFLGKIIWHFLLELNVYSPYVLLKPFWTLTGDESIWLYANPCGNTSSCSVHHHYIWKLLKCPSVDGWINKLWISGTMEYTQQYKEWLRPNICILREPAWVQDARVRDWMWWFRWQGLKE